MQRKEGVVRALVGGQQREEVVRSAEDRMAVGTILIKDCLRAQRLSYLQGWGVLFFHPGGAENHKRGAMCRGHPHLYCFSDHSPNHVSTRQ